MSIEAMNWSYQQKVGNPGAKSVLVSLSNQADQDGKCWPSIDYIVNRTEIPRRSVIRYLQNLEDQGFISSTVRPGDGSGRKSNLYHLNIGQCATVAQRGKVPKRGGQSAKLGGQSATVAPKQSINNSKNNQSTSNAERFDEWWEAYPKKVEKKKSKAIWIQRKLDRIADTIIDDTRTRPTRCARWQAGFAPNPTTYLNGDRWEDEPIKPKESEVVNRLPTDDTKLETWAKQNNQRGPLVGETYPGYRRHLETSLRSECSQ